MSVNECSFQWSLTSEFNLASGHEITIQQRSALEIWLTLLSKHVFKRNMRPRDSDGYTSGTNLGTQGGQKLLNFHNLFGKLSPTVDPNFWGSNGHLEMDISSFDQEINGELEKKYPKGLLPAILTYRSTELESRTGNQVWKGINY